MDFLENSSQLEDRLRIRQDCTESKIAHTNVVNIQVREENTMSCGLVQVKEEIDKVLKFLVPSYG
jgi:hypothetical protein